jgi:hypothetical protein
MREVRFPHHYINLEKYKEENMPYTQTIVTEIRRKTNGEFETPVSIGAKQKYIGALLNSHNNMEQNLFYNKLIHLYFVMHEVSL